MCALAEGFGTKLCFCFAKAVIHEAIPCSSPPPPLDRCCLHSGFSESRIILSGPMSLLPGPAAKDLIAESLYLPYYRRRGLFEVFVFGSEKLRAKACEPFHLRLFPELQAKMSSEASSEAPGKAPGEASSLRSLGEGTHVMRR